MNQWKRNFDSLQIQQRSESAVQHWENVSVEGLDENALSGYMRLVKTLKLLHVKILNTDPDIFAINRWGSVPNYYDNIKSNAESFRNKRNSAYIQNANEQLDQLLTVIRPSEINNSTNGISTLMESQDLFYRKICEILSLSKSKVDESVKQVKSLSEVVDSLKGKVQEAEQNLQQQKLRLDQAITEHVKQFSSAQDARSKEFSQLTAQIEDNFKEKIVGFSSDFEIALKEKTEKFDLILKSNQNESDGYLNLFEERKVKVDEIFGAIGSTAFAGVFKNTADNEAKSANIWRRVALVFMAVMIGVAGYAFYYSIGHETDWRVFAFRLGTAAVLAIPAIYAANESTKHRELERVNRRFHLELASIDAYLVLLPEDQRNQIKGKLAERFFGATTPVEKHNEVSSKDMFTTLSNVLNNLTKGK